MKTKNAEAWHVQKRGPCIEVIDENRLLVACVAGDGRERSVQETAYVIAAAPQLQEQLAAVMEWIENNVAYGAPRALLEDASQALQDSRIPL